MEKKNVLALGSRSVFLLAGLMLLLTSFACAYNLEEYFPLNSNDSWVYAVSIDNESYQITQKVAEKELANNIETIKIVDSQGGYVNLAFDLDGIKKYRNVNESSHETYNPARVIFPNIGIGESREYSGVATDYSPDNKIAGELKISDKVILESTEDIEVAAGKFEKCLKFSLALKTAENDGSYEQKDCSIWLAQGIGKVKEICLSTAYDAGTEKVSIESKTETLISAVVGEKSIGAE